MTDVKPEELVPCSDPHGGDHHLHSILVTGHDGHPSRGDTIQSIRFQAKDEIYTVPEQPLEDYPDFFSEEERLRAISPVKEIAGVAINDDDAGSDERVAKASGPCFACCGTPDVEAPGIEETQLTEESIARLSSKRINQEVERRLKQELSCGPSLLREDSIRISGAAISFSCFLVRTRTTDVGDLLMPVPLVDYLPPSPFLTFDGKLGVECKAFKLDFTDALHNIIPPFFMSEAEANDGKIKEILERGVSYARTIEMF